MAPKPEMTGGPLAKALDKALDRRPSVLVLASMLDRAWIQCSSVLVPASLLGGIGLVLAWRQFGGGGGDGDRPSRGLFG